MPAAGLRSTPALIERWPVGTPVRVNKPLVSVRTMVSPQKGTSQAFVQLSVSTRLPSSQPSPRFRVPLGLPPKQPA